MNYSEDFIQKMWETATPDPLKDSKIWRKDKYKAWIKRGEYNQFSEFGWKIHQNPFDQNNQIVFHWQNMTERTEDGMGWVWKIIASGDKNITYKNSCYIATACYGDINAPEVILFRKYRDEVLYNFFLGRLIVTFYYICSPFLSNILKNKTKLNKFVKEHLLDKLIQHIK